MCHYCNWNLILIFHTTDVVYFLVDVSWKCSFACLLVYFNILEINFINFCSGYSVRLEAFVPGPAVFPAQRIWERRHINARDIGVLPRSYKGSEDTAGRERQIYHHNGLLRLLRGASGLSGIPSAHIRENLQKSSKNVFLIHEFKVLTVFIMQSDIFQGFFSVN